MCAETRTHEDPAGPGVSAETPAQEDPAATRGERDADALMLMADTLLARGAAQRNGADRYQVVVHVDRSVLEEQEHGFCGRPPPRFLYANLSCKFRH